MADDGIPESLAEQRLGREVPGMHGLYATPRKECATASSTLCRPAGMNP
jgi:hypothetical protein